MGRPRTKILDAPRITAAAMQLCAERGDLTMNQLAGQLAVTVSSLYNHVASKSELINLIRAQWAEEILGQLTESAPGTERLSELMIGLYDRASSVAALIPMLYQQMVPVSRLFDYYEEVLVCLAAIGITTDDEAAGALSLIEAFVLGSALEAGSPGLETNEHDVAINHPRFHAAITAVETTTQPHRQEFLLGLRLLLTGLTVSKDHTL